MSCERGLAGVNVAVFPDKETVPDTAPLNVVTVKVVELIVEGFTALLKVALIGADKAAPIAL